MDITLERFLSLMEHGKHHDCINEVYILGRQKTKTNTQEDPPKGPLGLPGEWQPSLFLSPFFDKPKPSLLITNSQHSLKKTKPT